MRFANHTQCIREPFAQAARALWNELKSIHYARNVCEQFSKFQF